MRNKACKACALLLVLLFASFALPKATGQENEFARWEELKRGQDGYMDTVFEGVAIERIAVKYVGTTPHPMSAKEKAIVIKLLDSKRIPKDAVAVAGTSGSPVYFNVRGKLRLVGAAAFSFNDFPKSGMIMGVTPIEAMISGSRFTVLRAGKLPATIFDPQRGVLKIRWLPIYFDGAAVPAPATPAQPASRRPLAGDSVTVMFPDGGGGICTITYVRGINYWACGHGILPESSGETELSFPSYRTQITTTMFGARDSYKMFDRNLEFFGTIIKNDSFAIKGKISESAPQ